MVRLPRILLAGLALAGVALPAQGAVTVVGGGLAQACSQAVRAGQADQSVLNLCTISLETEALRRRDRAGTFVNRGIVQLRLRSLDNALKDLARAERLNPVIGEIYVNRGAVLISQRKFDTALSEIDRGLALGIEEPGKAYYNRALAKEGLDDTKGAYLDFRRASELDPTWDLPRNQLARFTVTRRSS
jgi:tetratricopeptide (TPR) repeat protein